MRTRTATIVESGGYPFSDSVKLEIRKTAGGEWPLFVRIPGWCTQPSIKVNGLIFEGAVSPRTFTEIRRVWQAGDLVELSFPSKPAVSRWQNNSLAVMRGPLLYALRIDAKEKAVDVATWERTLKDTGCSAR